MKLYATSRISRRLGERFFFKPERDASPKSAMVRRPYPPGMHGKKRRRGSSEFGLELREKQKVRHLYGLTDAMLKRYVARAGNAAGKTKTQALVGLLERRLDNVVFRLGLAASRRTARHVIVYGHISVNGKPVRRPAMLMKPGDRVSVREANRVKLIFEGLAVRLKKYQPPEWLAVSPEEASGNVVRLPTEADALTTTNLSKVIESYSR